MRLMHGLKGSILKRWHSLTVSPARLRRFWAPPYWQDAGGFRDIACAHCRKFNPASTQCSIRFGTPLRKCVVAAIEAHLNDLRGEEVLEIGFGSYALARNLVRRSGGRWTGIDPGQPVSAVARLGHGGYGHAAEIPFRDQQFDRVFAIQSLEHWGQKAAPRREPSDYIDCMNELLRVLKPGGRVYLDAPVHFHGHEMFIMGDTQRIRALFDPRKWDELVLERWRYHYQPLEPYPPSQKVLAEWDIEISSYPDEQVAAARDSSSVWLLTCSARKKPAGSPAG